MLLSAARKQELKTTLALGQIVPQLDSPSNL